MFRTLFQGGKDPVEVGICIKLSGDTAEAKGLGQFYKKRADLVVVFKVEKLYCYGDFRVAIEGYVKKGLLTEGSTPEELAEKLSIDPQALAETIRKYNEYQKNGNDPDFGRKDTEMPRPLSEGPYFAVEVGPAIHHTMGGIKINTEAQVLDSKNQPVPGLFAAGEVTGGIHGGNRLGGNAVADICVYGKIAADSAVEYIKQ